MTVNTIYVNPIMFQCDRSPVVEVVKYVVVLLLPSGRLDKNCLKPAEVRPDDWVCEHCYDASVA